MEFPRSTDLEHGYEPDELDGGMDMAPQRVPSFSD
jgi:hypothetical protein